MKLVHPLLCKPISFCESQIPLLVVEHTAAYQTMLFDLWAQSEGENGPFVLSEGYVPLDCGDCLRVVQDFYHLPLDDRRLQNRFQSALKHLVEEELAAETFLLNQRISEYLGLLTTRLESPVSFSQGDFLLPLLKALRLQPALEEGAALERLIQYIDLYCSLLEHQCFILVGAKSFFAPQELSELYRMARYKKWRLLLLEHVQHNDALPEEIYYVLDQDLCELRLDCEPDIR